MGVNGNFCAISIANSQAIMQNSKWEIILYRHSYNYLTYGCLFFILMITIDYILVIFHKTNVQSISPDVLMIIYSYLIQMRRLIGMNKITKEQIDEVLNKHILIVGENIPDELVEQIANNVEHMSEQEIKFPAHLCLNYIIYY